MNQIPLNFPVYDGEPLQPEEQRVKLLFNEIRRDQLTLIDQAGKRIIELSTGMLGLLFTISAVGADFPPPGLRSTAPGGLGLLIAAICAYILALLFGVLTIQPQVYLHFEFNLTRMAAELDKMVRTKVRRMRLANIFFFIGTFMLATLVVLITTASM